MWQKLIDTIKDLTTVINFGLALAKVWSILTQFWPIVFSGLVSLASVVLLISKVGNNYYTFQLPLWTWMFVLALVTYPILKLIQWLFTHRERHVFSYGGLNWRAPVFRFGTPTPLCPIRDCGLEVDWDYEPPPSYLLVSSRGDFDRINRQIRTYTYKAICPVHDVVQTFVNEPPATVYTRAKAVYKQKLSQRKSAPRKT